MRINYTGLGAGVRFRGFVLVFLLCAAICISLEAKSDVPAWLDIVLDTSLTNEDKEADLVVLYDWVKLDYSSKGSAISSSRWVVKINHVNARDEAIANLHYNKKGFKLKEYQVWLIQPDGKVSHYDKRDARVYRSGMRSLYSEGHTMQIDLSESVQAGTVFAVEKVFVNKTIFSQSRQYVHGEDPKKYQVIEIVVPDGWEAKFTRVNNAEGEMSQSGNTYRWEVTNPTPWIREDSGLGYYALAGYVGIDIHPVAGRANTSNFELFSDWQDVAEYGARVNDVMSKPDTDIQSKAKELCRDTDTAWEKIVKVSKYAQSLNYVSISEDLNMGGGNQPFSAKIVFERGYGDCKDMSSLTKAMLESVGVESYSVWVNGPGRYVNEEWASGGQFNHCIVAIKVDEGIDNEAVVEHPELGRLLYFDPTLQDLPVGDLPYYIGDSKVLVLSSENKTLQHLPPSQMKNNLIEQKVEYTVEVNGTIYGTIKESYHGGAALSKRSLYRNNGSEDFEDLERGWLAKRMRDVRIESLVVDDLFDDSKINLDIEFEAPTYARSIRGRMLVFQPIVCYRTESLPPADEERKTPYKLGSKNLHLHTTIKIPDGFKVEETGKDLDIESKFGHYIINYTKGEGELIVDLHLKTYFQDVSPEDYPDLVKFSKKILKADQTPVLLMKL